MKFASYRDCQKRICRRPYWNYAIHNDYQNGINRRRYRIRSMLLIDITKKELTGGPIGIIIFIGIANLE